jgi:hypothetical protein
MDLIDKMERMEGVRLPGSGGRSPDIQSSHRTRRAEHHRAARGSPEILGMADMKPGNVGDGVVHGPFLSAKSAYSYRLGGRKSRQLHIALPTPAFGEKNPSANSFRKQKA